MLDWFQIPKDKMSEKLYMQNAYIMLLTSEYTCIYLYYHWKTTETFLCFNILCHFQLKSNIGHYLDKLIINHNNLNKSNQ